MIAAQPGRESARGRIGAHCAAGAVGAPTVPRMLVGFELRRLREASGITREAAGKVIRASDAKLSRLESGRASFKERDLTDLLTLYGATDEHEREVILALARQARAAGWWAKYRDVLPGWCERYVGLEQAAAIIRTYEVQFLPGLLQTEDYAHAVSRLGDPTVSSEEVERRVSLRMTRQRLLTQPQAPNLWAVVDEAALRRPLGGQRVMRAQLRHVIELTELPNVTLQVVPFHLGGHAAAGGAFALLRFAEPDLPDIVYLEQLTNALYLDKRREVEHYVRVMERLCHQAEPPAETTGILDGIIADT